VLRHLIQQHTEVTNGAIRKAQTTDDMHLKLLAAKKKAAEAETALMEARKENGRILGTLSIRETAGFGDEGGASAPLQDRDGAIAYGADGQPITSRPAPVVDELIRPGGSQEFRPSSQATSRTGTS
jgi:hypothetical protein